MSSNWRLRFYPPNVYSAYVEEQYVDGATKEEAEAIGEKRLDELNAADPHEAERIFGYSLTIDPVA